MLSNLQIGIKNYKQELRKSTETFKVILPNDPIYSPNFLEYAKKLYNEVPKPLCEVGNYCKMISKLKKYSFNKTLARFLTKLKKYC